MKTKSKISGYIIRSGAWAVFLSVAFIAASSAFNSPNAWDKSASATSGYDRMAKSPSQPRTFSFVERVRFNEQLKTFTGDTGFGQKRILIPSHRSMR